MLQNEIVLKYCTFLASFRVGCRATTVCHRQHAWLHAPSSLTTGEESSKLLRIDADIFSSYGACRISSHQLRSVWTDFLWIFPISSPLPPSPSRTSCSTTASESVLTDLSSWIFQFASEFFGFLRRTSTSGCWFRPWTQRRLLQFGHKTSVIHKASTIFRGIWVRLEPV